MSDLIEPLKPIGFDPADISTLNITYDIPYTDEELSYYATALVEPDLEDTEHDFGQDMVCIKQTNNPFKRYWSHFCGRRIKFFVDQYEKWGDSWMFIDEEYVVRKMSKNASN
jgi:hypothetical protein